LCLQSALEMPTW